MNRIALATLALAALPQAAFAEPPASEYRDERVHVRLLSEHTSVRAGSPFALGLQFDLADHWHVYWRNPGDSGEPPSLRWTLPSGFRAGEIEWPLPETIRDEFLWDAEAVVRGSGSADEALRALDREADQVLEKRRWLLAGGRSGE